MSLSITMASSISLAAGCGDAYDGVQSPAGTSKSGTVQGDVRGFTPTGAGSNRRGGSGVGDAEPDRNGSNAGGDPSDPESSGGDTGDAPQGLGPDDVWGAALGVPVVDPRDFGAIAGDGGDDTAALDASVKSLPSTGGVVLFPSGVFTKDRKLWTIRKDHVFLWAPSGRATLHGVITNSFLDPCGSRQQATVFEEVTGGGVFGLHFTSNATQRMSCATDAHVVIDSCSGIEIVGIEAERAATNGVFVWRRSTSLPKSVDTYLEGNYFHHNYADAVHNRSATRRTFAWRNYIYNGLPTEGDDGLACVTYSENSPLCGDMEWWNNVYLGGAHGRGMAVVGGDNIRIHHNWIIGANAAGLIVASEASYTTPGSHDISLTDNWLVDSPNHESQPEYETNGHSAILLHGGNSAAGPLWNITVRDNVVVDPGESGQAYRVGGDVALSTLDDADAVLSTSRSALPGIQPTLNDVVTQDTRVLRTRDVSFAPSATRKGLYRIHMREQSEGSKTLETRFEYVVSAAPSDMASWLDSVTEAGAYLSDMREVGGIAYALLLSASPLTLPPSIGAVSFDQLRAGDRDATLGWLWERVDMGDY